METNFENSEVKNSSYTSTTGTTNTVVPSFDFDSFEASYIASETLTPTPTNPSEQSELNQPVGATMPGVLNSEVVLLVFDLFMSRITTIGARLAGISCDFKDMQMTLDEKKMIKPAFDACVTEWLKKLKPIHLLIFSLVMIYGSKLVTVGLLQETDPKEVKKQKAKEEKENTGAKGKQGRHKLSCAKHLDKSKDCNCK